MSTHPEKLGNILTQLMARRGWARVRSQSLRESAWREAAGPVLARYSRLGAVRRGTAEVIVANSVLAHELTYQKAQLLARLGELLPDEPIQDLSFRAGTVGK